MKLTTSAIVSFSLLLSGQEAFARKEDDPSKGLVKYPSYIKDLQGFDSIPDYQKPLSQRLTSSKATTNLIVQVKSKDTNDDNDDDDYKIYEPLEFFSLMDEAIKDLSSAFENYDPNKENQNKSEPINTALLRLEDIFKLSLNESLSRFPLVKQEDKDAVQNELHDLYNDARDLLDVVVGMAAELESEFRKELERRFGELWIVGRVIVKWLAVILNGWGQVGYFDGLQDVMRRLREVMGKVDGTGRTWALRKARMRAEKINRKERNDITEKGGRRVAIMIDVV